MWNRNVAVGVFAITGTALFVVATFLIGDQHSFFTTQVELYTTFKNVDGLGKGAKVRVGGFDAGEVKEIRVPASPGAGFRLKLELSEQTRALIRTDSVATIATEGVVGEKYVLVAPGSTSAPEAAPFSTIPGRETSDIAALLQKGTDLVGNASEILKSVSTKLNTALDAATTAINNADDLVLGLKQGKGSIGMLLRDEKTATEIRDAIRSLRSATSSLDHASSQADALVSDLQSRSLPAKVDDIVSDLQTRKFGQKLDQTIDDVQVAVKSVDATTQQLQETVSRALAQDERGKDAADNIRETLSNVNQATANMAEDTEALKRGFFFRGFFKRRGYYSMDRLAPEAYRKDKVFADPKNPRAWIEASDLFERNPGQAETLSRSGEARIDAAVDRFGDRAIGSAIVIEGYAISDVAADALALSRTRAILVRNYLRTRFRIDNQNIGAVPMRNLPPPATHKESWDGICLVILTRSAA